MKIKLIWTFVISFVGLSMYSLVYPQTTSSTVTPVVLNKKPPVISVDSNMMTYTNSEYGFQFQYPNSMGSTIRDIQPEQIGGYPRNENDYVHEVSTSKSNNFDPNIEIAIYRNKKGNSDTPGLKNEILKLYEVSNWSEVLATFPGGVSKTLNINGYEAIKINYNYPNEYSISGTPAIAVFISNSKYIFNIGFWENLKKVDQILGTFKILNN